MTSTPPARLDLQPLRGLAVHRAASTDRALHRLNVSPRIVDYTDRGPRASCSPMRRGGGAAQPPRGSGHPRHRPSTRRRTASSSSSPRSRTETVDKRMHFCDEGERGLQGGGADVRVAARSEFSKGLHGRHSPSSSRTGQPAPHRGGREAAQGAHGAGDRHVTATEYGLGVGTALESSLGRIKRRPGLDAAFGGGFTWGAALLPGKAPREDRFSFPGRLAAVGMGRALASLSALPAGVEEGQVFFSSLAPLLSRGQRSTELTASRPSSAQRAAAAALHSAASSPTGAGHSLGEYSASW